MDRRVTPPKRVTSLTRGPSTSMHTGPNLGQGSCLGWIHLQQTRMDVAFAGWKFLLYLSLKTTKHFNG